MDYQGCQALWAAKPKPKPVSSMAYDPVCEAIRQADVVVLAMTIMTGAS
jgi:multimeric flavodoxin WrbA